MEKLKKKAEKERAEKEKSEKVISFLISVWLNIIFVFWFNRWAILVENLFNIIKLFIILLFLSTRNMRTEESTIF